MNASEAQKLAAALQESERDRFGRVEVQWDPETNTYSVVGRPYTDHNARVKLA